MSRCLVGLGSNLGDRAAYLTRAIASLRQNPHVRIVAESQPHTTRPVGGPADQGDFLNAAICCETNLSPVAILDLLQNVERSLGRKREEPWAARTIDLDLLLYDDLQINTERLVVPHPRLSFRRFVLASAAEVAEQMVHSPTGFTVGELLERLDQSPAYVAVSGDLHRNRPAAVLRAAREVGCRLLPDPVAARWPSLVLYSDRNRDITVQLQALSERVAALSATPMPTGPSLATDHVISDFWCGEALALANLTPTDGDRSPFASIWDTMPERLLRPKLLIYFLPQPDLEREAAPAAAGTKWELELRRLVSRPRQFPVLWLMPEDIDTAVREISASLLAMQRVEM